KKMEKYISLQTIKENVDKRLKTTLKELTEVKIELLKYQELQSQLIELEKQVEERKDLEGEIKKLEQSKKNYTLIESHLDTLRKKRKQKEDSIKKDLKIKANRLKKEQSRIRGLSTTIDHETAFKLLNQEGRLLERIQRISLEQSWNLTNEILQELHEEQLQARKDLKELQTGKNKINKDSFLLSEITQRISELEEEV
ncbi:MAG: hypothetical protein ACFFDT_21820, partial [Candidatus Hodarchaeota archaeon]